MVFTLLSTYCAIVVVDYRLLLRECMYSNIPCLQHFLEVYTLCIRSVNRLSNCHTFTVSLFILLSFKHQPTKPTAISVEQNQWKEKDKIQNFQNTQSNLSIFSVIQTKSPPLTVPPLHHLTTCTLTTSNVRLTSFLPTAVTYLHLSCQLTFHCRNSRYISIAYVVPIDQPVGGNCEFFVKL
jgi:hypothetical protein